MAPQVTRSRLFRSKRRRAVRLPKNLAFPPHVREVTIVRGVQWRVIIPAGALWDDFFDRSGIDLGERAQPGHQEREVF